MTTGGICREEIQSIADRTKIGDRIKYTSIREKTESSEPRIGKVIGKYPSFCLVDTGLTRESILWVDIIGVRYV